MKPTVYIAMTVLMFFLQSARLQAKDVALITTGEGASKELAVREALVAAVEQAYGVYVSGNTHILDDELIRDEVVQIKRGNIKKYNILNELKLPDKSYSVTLETTVSTDKLLKFAESKGATCELAGKTVASNLELYKLYLSNGARAMKHLYNTLGWIVPKMYDYKLHTGEPIVYKSDVYVPVAVDCVLNDNFETFLDLYNSTNRSITASIESVPVHGDTGGKDMSTIDRYRGHIMDLPEIWIYGFLLRDNLDNFVIPLLNSSKVNLPENAFWPSVGIRNYSINQHYNGQEYISGLPAHSYIIAKGGGIVLKSNGIRVQKLNYAPLCSLGDGESGAPILRDYVKSVEDKFSKSRAGYADVYDIRDFDDMMTDWSGGYTTQSKWNGIRHNWIDDATKVSGKSVCTIHFLLCYKDTDIAKVSEIKVEPLNQSDDV